MSCLQGSSHARLAIKCRLIPAILQRRITDMTNFVHLSFHPSSYDKVFFSNTCVLIMSYQAVTIINIYSKSRIKCIYYHYYLSWYECRYESRGSWTECRLTWIGRWSATRADTHIQTFTLTFTPADNVKSCLRTFSALYKLIDFEIGQISTMYHFYLFKLSVTVCQVCDVTWQTITRSQCLYQSSSDYEGE